MAAAITTVQDVQDFFRTQIERTGWTNDREILTIGIERIESYTDISGSGASTVGHQVWDVSFLITVADATRWSVTVEFTNEDSATFERLQQCIAVTATAALATL